MSEKLLANSDMTPTLPKVVDMPNSIEVRADCTEEDIIKADLPTANAIMDAVHLCWGSVKSIGGVQRLIKMTIEATKHRRDVLGLPYGSKAKDEGKSGMVYPLD